MTDAWQHIIGNTRVLQALRRVARSGSLGHAYVFSGPDGCGKLLASLAFAREINCRCGGGAQPCEACRSLDTLSHLEVLVITDANKPRWFKRRDLLRRLGLDGADSLRLYAETVVGVYEKGYLEDPMPRIEDDDVVDGFSIVTDNLFGRGSVPKECYTPGQVSEAIRKALDRGDLSQAEFGLLRELYEQPLSVMPYRGTIHLAYVTPRKDWKFTRPIQTFLSVRSMLGGRKVVIIDDAEKMTEQAQNCLLKTLEEPPPDSVLILVTSDRHSLFPTIVSRCQVINFERLTSSEMELAAAALLPGKGTQLALATVLAENCPGKLLEAANQDVVGRLVAVRDFFTALAQDRLEGVFIFSAAVLRDAGSHRKKTQQTLRQMLELVILWIIEVLRTKQGLPGRIQGPDYKAALETHAQRFDETGLIAASRVIEQGLGLAAINVDMGLLTTTTLFRVAEALGARAFGEAAKTRPTHN
jgi:DNA polymerase-3 subunit delta'